jgi:alpha-beta hydrolase superfamily lysophospholipase
MLDKFTCISFDFVHSDLSFGKNRKTMATLPSQFKTNDNLTLKMRHWSLPNPRAIVCLVHGFGEHSGRYAHVGQFFNEQNISLVAFDIRGHGESEGKRGHSPSYDAYLDDIQLFIDTVKKEYGDLPLFIYGHSMGGGLVLSYMIRRSPSNIKGIIASGPWIRLAFEPKPILITLGKLMRSIYPTFTQNSGLVREHLSRDPSVVEANRNDKLVCLEITASAGMGLTEGAAFLNEFEGDFPVPALIMHGGDDKITSQPASEAFSKRAKGNITYRKWEDMYHEIHNEPEKLMVLNHALAWLNDRI